MAIGVWTRKYGNQATGHTSDLKSGFEWKINSQNIPGNSSNITVREFIEKGPNNYPFNGNPAISYYEYDGGNRQNVYTTYDSDGMATGEIAYIGSSRFTGVSRTFDVSHNADGSRQLYIKTFAALDNGGSCGDFTTEDTITLDTIPRNATISGYSDFNIGNNAVLTVTNPGSLYNTLDFIADGVIVKSVEGILSGSQSNLITAADLYQKCPNSNSLQVTAQLKTWTSSAKTSQVGTTQTTNANALVTNSNPVFTDFAFEDIDATVKLLTDSDQKLVSGYSDVRATITTANKATAQNYATMDKYRLTIGALTIEENYSAVASVLLDLANILSGTIIVTAIDSRGNQTSVTKTATILSLTGIYFNSAEILRDNGADATVKLDMSGKVHLLNFGSVTNSVKSIKYQYKETSQDDESYSELATISSGSYSVDGSGNITISDLAIDGNLGASGFTIEKSYNIKLEIKDELTTAYLVIELLSGVYVLHLGRTGAHARVGCGMKNNVGQGFQSKDGFYDKNGAQLCPPGMSFEWNSDTIPTGYLEENGSAVSRTTYAGLFAVIGTTFGVGDGSTTFNLPNAKGKVAVGRDTSQTEFDVTGETGGDKNPQSHYHDKIYDGSGVYPTASGYTGTGVSVLYSAFTFQTTNQYFYKTNSSGTGNSGNLQPYIVKRKIIKY